MGIGLEGLRVTSIGIMGMGIKEDNGYRLIGYE